MKNNTNMPFLILILIFLILILPIITYSSPVNFLCEGDSGEADCQVRNQKLYFNNATPNNFKSVIDSDYVFTPLIDNLDNDPYNEIYLLKFNQIKVYEYINNLTLSGIYNSTMGNFFPSPSIRTIAGTKYVIAAQTNGTWINIDFLRFYQNNTLTPEKNVTFKINGQTISAIGWFGCSNDDKCMVAYAPIIGGNAPKIIAYGFDINGLLSNNVSIFDDSKSDFCFSRYANFVVTDSDFDGKDNYIITVPDSYETTNVKYRYFNIQSNSSGAPNLKCSDSIEDNSITANLGCTASFDSKISVPLTLTQSPLVSDFTSTYSGKEVIVGYQRDGDSFRMASFKGGDSNNCGHIDSYPELLESFGQIKSAPFRANIYKDNLNDEFCVLGYDRFATTGYLDLVCATFGESPSAPKTEDYVYQSPLEFNVTDQIKATSYSVSVFNADPEFVGQDQILTPYGWHYAIFDSILGNNFFGRQWNLPVKNSTIVPFDINNDTHLEIIANTPTNLFVFLDSYSVLGAQGAKITSIETNPCINFTVMQNTTFQVSAIVQNAENSGQVAARAVMYYGTIHEYNTTLDTANSKSGGVTFNWILPTNVSFTNAKFVVIANDSLKPDFYDQVERTVTITDSIDAQIYGQSDCSVYTASAPTIQGGIATTTTTNPNEINVENNLLNRALDKLNSLFDNNLGRTVWWIIFMIMFAISILFAGLKYGHHIKAVMGILVFSEVLLFIIGVFIHVLSVALVIVLIIICLIVIGVWIIDYIS